MIDKTDAPERIWYDPKDEYVAESIPENHPAFEGCFEYVRADLSRPAPVTVTPLEVEERRSHRLGLGPYEVCPNGPDKDGSGMWRVRYHGKVICKKIKGVKRAVEWVQKHHREHILSALTPAPQTTTAQSAQLILDRECFQDPVVNNALRKLAEQEQE